ncbi:hypothetical protein OMW55_09495 [Sphingomonas sp. BN140010]|uniref:Uncharacterized protein n=1 Tax=Sphingomonas arvum TaxID=2992113 RepID=A0ABT3JG22_9SPHN|nr:hypothetical protein [Sphingomonas sp. BN140010]MCW3798036.1 hypothetical protein [Sphingomonas sp. BN140010]
MKLTFLALPLVLLPALAGATPGLEIELAMVSDCRDRGDPPSDAGAAVQGSFSARGPRGSYG